MTVNQQHCAALAAEKAQPRKKTYSASIQKKCKTGFEVYKESREKSPVSVEVVVTVCARWRQ